jgi:hypothetical protein
MELRNYGDSALISRPVQCASRGRPGSTGCGHGPVEVWNGIHVDISSGTRIGKRAVRQRAAIIRCGEPVQLQLWVRIFCLQSRRSARCRPGPWAFDDDDGSVPVICPTCQMFSKDRSKHPGWRDQATLHGVVFDILVGSGHRGDLAAGFPDDDRTNHGALISRPRSMRLRRMCVRPSPGKRAKTGDFIGN